MVLVEKVFYELGGLIGDFIFISIAPTGVFTASKVVSKFSSIASQHVLVDRTVERISENLFECLPFIE